MSGQIVLITGTSGAGKSTACREFRDTADDLWMLYGADLVLGTLIPGKFVEGGLKASECMHIEPDDPAQPMGACHMELGKLGPGLIASWHEMMAAAARAGINVIGDHILLTSPPFLQDCLLRLQGLPVLLVALVPPEDVLDARIADNERLTEGAAAAGLSTEQVAAITAKLQHVGKYMTREIFSHDVFDLVLDSGALSPAEIVEKIRTRLKEGPGEAFDKLAENFDLSSDFWGDDPYTSMGDGAVALTINSKIADLLANEEAKAIIDKHAPGIVTEPKIAQAAAMTLEFIMPMTGGLITPEALKAIDDDLKKLTPSKPAPTINSKIADLLDDERAKAIIDKHIPGLVDEPKLSMAASMTLEFIMPMTEGLITPEALKAIEEDFSKL